MTLYSCLPSHGAITSLYMNTWITWKVHIISACNGYRPVRLTFVTVAIIIGGLQYIGLPNFHSNSSGIWTPPIFPPGNVHMDLILQDFRAILAHSSITTGHHFKLIKSRLGHIFSIVDWAKLHGRQHRHHTVNLPHEAVHGQQGHISFTDLTDFPSYWVNCVLLRPISSYHSSALEFFTQDFLWKSPQFGLIEMNKM